MHIETANYQGKTQVIVIFDLDEAGQELNHLETSYYRRKPKNDYLPEYYKKLKKALSKINGNIARNK